MRRKIVPTTPKILGRSGLECLSCLRWENVEEVEEAKRKKLKAGHVRHVIKEWGEFGKIVYIGDQAIAYAQYAPAEFWPGTNCFKAGPVSGDAVLLACLVVQPMARGRGLGRVLLQSIESGLVKRKVKAIEVFASRDDNHPPGPVDFYIQNGFYIVRDDRMYPLLRIELKTLVGWQINIQFALDRIKIPSRSVVAPTA